MRITDALLGEHGAFYAQFERIEAMPDGAPVAEVREQATLLAAALVSHAQLEDELLFARMLAAGGNPGLLGTMEEEHQVIAGHLERAQGTADGRRALAELREAVAVAREHFAKEEQIAFPLAGALLRDGELEALGLAWSGRRGVSLPPL